MPVFPASSATDVDAAWTLVLAAARAAGEVERNATSRTFALDGDGGLTAVPASAPDAVLAWRVGSGWEPFVPASDPRHALLDLYLPIASATAAHPTTVGHLGQSLDGFIATDAGDSQFVTGEENILHLHRMRALCDAVVVGPGTVAADNPQLTTRKVAGPHPLRVVLDASRRLGQTFRIFEDTTADTIYVTTEGNRQPGETHVGLAPIVTVPEANGGLDLAAVLRMLRDRGCARVFVEGGGVTVSLFLEADLLDRLQVAVAPLIIGSGRPAIRLPGRPTLRDCRRPRYRVFRMGGDVFFDCDLRVTGEGPEDGGGSLPSVLRVI